MIFNSKKDIISYLKTASAVVETKRAYEGDVVGESRHVTSNLTMPFYLA
jgi:hypothetical protein